MLKEKVKLMKNRREKLQLLTLIPDSWNREKISTEFNVTDYTVRQSRQLLKDQGILAMPDIGKGKHLSQATITLITNLYESDEYSRIMRGKKDIISISKNIHVQKRLLLCNLRELYFLSNRNFLK